MKAQPTFAKATPEADFAVHHWQGTGQHTANIHRYQIGRFSTADQFTASLQAHLGATVFKTLRFEFRSGYVDITTPPAVEIRVQQTIREAVDATSCGKVGIIHREHGKLMYQAMGKAESARTITN